MNRFLHAVKRNAIAGLMMVFVLGISQVGLGQLLLNEDFNTGYTTASNLAGQNSWTKGGTGPDVTVQNASPITYSGYNGGGGGNYILMPAASSTTSRVYKGFTTTSAGTNTMYFSFLLNLSSTAATGDYFITLGDPTTGTAYFARVFAQTSGAGYNIGIAKAAATGTYGTTVLSFNQTYLIVVRFTFVSGATNDQAYIWVNPSLASEPPAGSPEATISSGSDPGLSGGNVGNFLWHNRSTNNPVGKFDGVRVALGSTSAIAWTNLAAAVSSTNYYLKSGGSIGTLADWGQNTDGTGTNSLTSIGDANITWNIRNNAGITLGAAWTLGSGSKVIVGDGTNATNFTIPSGFAVTGTVDVAAAATLSIANTTNPTLGTLAATSTVAYTATAPQTVPLASYGNLSVSTTGGNATAGGAITVTTALTVASGSTFNLSTNALSGAALTTSGMGTLQVGNTTATPIPTGRTWSMDVAYNSASAQTVVAGTYSNLNITGGNRTLINGGTIGVSGTYTPGAGTLTVTGNTINFSSASTQTIPAATYNNITNTGNGNRTLASIGTIDIAGTFTPGSGTYTVTGSTVNYSGSTAITFPTFTYNNLTISGSSTYSIGAGNTLTVGGDFSQPGSGTFNVSNAAGTGTLNVTGNFALSSGIFNLINNGSSTAATVTVTGNTTISGVGALNMEAVSSATGVAIFQTTDFTASSTSSSSNVDFGTGTITGNEFRIKGAFSITAGDFYTSATLAANGFVFNGTGTQTFSYTGTTSNYVQYVINSGSTVQLTSNLAIGTSTAAPASSFTVNGVLDVTNKVISGGTATTNPTIFTLGSTGTLKTAVATGVAGSITTAGTRTFTAGGKYEFNSTTAAQSTGFSGITINTPNLITISNTFGAVTADANVTFGNTASLVINSNSILDANTRTFTFGTGGVVTVNGTIRTGNTTATGALSGSATSTIVFTNTPTITLGSASVVEYNGIAAQFAAARTFPNLTINNSNGVTMLGDVSVTTTLALTNGALSIGGNTLTLNGTVTRTSGTLTGTSSSILSLGGSSAQSLAFATGASLASLNVAKTGGTSTLTSVGDTLRIYTGIDFTGNSSGVLALNGQEIKLKSNATGTAYIGQSSTTSLTGATAITVERYIPANSNRAWRLLAVPTTGSQTINSAWQNGQASGVAGTAGLGSWITSNVAGATSAGYDAQTPGNSLLTYNQTSNLWVGVTSNTTTTQLAPSGTDGYMLYVRGDRTSTNGNTTITPTTLFSRGGIKQNNQSAITVPAETNNATGNYVMIGNPFASTINLPSMVSTGFTDATALSVSVYDSKLGTLGGFVVLQYDGSNYTVQTTGSTTYPYLSTVNTIQSGQAFFVQSQDDLGTLAIPESAKRTTSSVVFRQTAARIPAKRYLLTQLYAGQDTAARFMDGTTQYFDPSFSNLVDYADARKLGNFSENLGISKGVATLSVEKRGAIAPADTIFFSISNMKIQGYQLRFIAAKLTQPGVRAFLEDSYLHTSTPVALNDTTTVNFTVDANAGSYASNRFRLVFKTRPVAIANNNTGTDGLSAVSNGTAKSISVYPNPVTGGIVNVSFKNEPAGNYRIVLYTLKGQALFTKTMSHAGGNAAQSLLIGKGIANGSYKLAVIHPDNTRTEQTIIVTK